ERLIPSGESAAGDGLGLPVGRRPEGARPYVRDPDLNRPQSLFPQPVPVGLYLLSRRLPLSRRAHATTPSEWLHVTYRMPFGDASVVDGGAGGAGAITLLRMFMGKPTSSFSVRLAAVACYALAVIMATTGAAQ